MSLRTWKLPLLGLLAALVGLLALSACKDDNGKKKEKISESDEPEEIPLDLDEALIKKTIARLGTGFMVWERFRNDRWEIWVKKLSGGKEKRIIPAEEGRDHACPKISPDGRMLVYMSYPKGKTGYPGHARKPGTLWLMNLVSRKRRVISKEARSYAEHRAVTWLDANRLCYIDGEGYSNEYDVKTGKTKRLVKQAHETFGYLVSPDMKHATSGTPEFALYDKEQQLVRNQQRMGGCQPYFTQDGQWGYWMGGAGGPINKMRLATREIGQVLQRDDARLHGKRNYVYFPMVSPCQRLMAFAASPDKHDHFTADYDIYLAHVHPKQFYIIGNPVRYTKFKGVDRYPDVFRRELPLGSHYVEGKTEMTFTIPKEYASGEWQWHITGRFNATGNSVTRVFDHPGEYWVEAKQGDKKLRGYVNVREAAPPLVDGVRREGKDGIIVDFDEPVLSDGASITVSGGAPVTGWQLINDGYAVSFHMPPGTAENATFEFDGFRDTAQQPNRMVKAKVSIPSVAWPASDEGMVFVWENVKGRTSLPNGTPCEVAPNGLAFWSDHGAMKLRGGWFDAPKAGELVSASCVKSNEVTVEMIITPQPAPFDKELHPILTLANSEKQRNLTIGQRGTRLYLLLRTPEQDPNAPMEETQLAGVDNNQPHHLVIAYRKDKLSVWIDGSAVWNRSRIRGDLSNWEDMKLRFGASSEGNNSWRGLIDRVVIYDRCLSDEEIAQHSNSSIVAESKRDPLKEWKVVAKLVEASPIPPLLEFQPYTEALVRHLYEVQEVTEGPPLPSKQIAVSHWIWMDAKALPAQQLKVGDVVHLTLHHEEEHTELKSLFVKDELIEGIGADRFHDATDWDAEIMKAGAADGAGEKK
ncbi:LamG-like jellyroll fold domain-containing protein [Roseimicrobium sp. ORNL1]|uniref:LamG-like jellyroll fold domain-containing protein n=1 Tax=Roseimicrobium sp. ORNL1 TaxID=2711231 RepID=UPI0013E16EAE|nr:LamG-like jellyroll fold domain-containing protein [Roseimicrobium sp. ORNL1]QIF04031.1 LamG domain-containing protein [Roseimicrobium sp. ORNL1]